VCPDHGLKHIPDLKDLAVTELTTSPVGPRDPVCDSEDGTKVVRRVTPLCGQPAVVEVEPPDHGTNVESAQDGVELVVGTRNLGAIGNNSALDDGAEDVPALLELKRLQTAAQSVNEDPTGSVKLWEYKISQRNTHWFID
jgi:hypothetical protein